MSETETEIELEETCWCTITILVSIIIAAFSYRFFGPENPETSKKTPEPTQQVYVQEIKREEPEQNESEPLIEKPTQVENVPLNESTESAATHHSRESSSGPEFEIIDASDVPSTNEIELSNETPKEEEQKIDTPTEETREEGPTESVITDVDIELVSNLPPSKNSDDEPQIPDEDIEETEAVQEAHQVHEEPLQGEEEDEIVPIDVKKGNLERYEDEIMQGNFADQTLFTPAKPVQSLPIETNDTLQDLELDQSDLNMTEDLLASPEKEDDSEELKTEESLKTEEEDAELNTPSKEEVSFENIPIIEDKRSESPDPIIAQQEIIPEASEPTPEVQDNIKVSSESVAEVQVQNDDGNNEPKVEERNIESPVQSTPEPDEEIIEENVITDTDSIKNEITESDIRKVAEDLIDKTLDNVEQKLKTDSIATELGSGDAATEAEIRAKQLAEIDALMKEKGMGELDPEQTKMYLE